MSDTFEKPWAEETEQDVAARKLLLEVGRVEQVNFEWTCDGFVYQQYASGRRLANVYGLTTAKTCTYPGSFPSMTAYDITSDNQIAIGVETLTTTVGAARPWCNFTTVDGDYRQRIKAQRKGDFFYGLLKDCGFYAQLPEMFRDMVTWGWGVAKSTAAKRGKKRGQKLRIASDRCVPSEVLWDRANNLIPGADTPIYHRRFVLKRDKMREHPDKAEQIATCTSAYTGNIPGLAVEVPADFICEVDAYWPSSDGETKGRHMTILSDSIVLVDEPMDADEGHPFTFCKAYNIGPGWQYQGVVEQVLGDQLRLGKQNAVIWENQHRGAQNRWMVEEGSNVSDGSLVNRTAQITRYKKQKPELVTFQANPPEMYTDRDATRTRILKRMGVNDFASQGLKPAGLNSGEALRQYGEKTAPRHVTLGRNLEDFVVDTVKKLDRLCEKVKPVVKAPGKRSTRKLTWDDVAMASGSYSVELAFPISSLPRTPEGQIDKASEMFQEATIDKVTLARLTLNPDTVSVIGPLAAAKDAIESILDGICEDGKYEAPDNGLALDMAFEMACTRYWRAVADKYPQDIRDMLCDWRDDVKRIMDEEKAKAAASAPAPAQTAPVGPQMVPAGDVIQGPQPTQLAAA